MIWNDRLSVEIEDIDTDHRIMVGLINNLHDAIAAGVGRQVIEGIIDEVVSYTDFHFAREERLFDLTSYAEAETHQKEHDDMRAWAKRAQDDYKSGSLPAPSLEVMMYLKDWLFDHILISDQKYAPYLKAMCVR
jgi:hemerythrin